MSSAALVAESKPDGEGYRIIKVISDAHTAFTLPHPRDIIERDFRDTSELANHKIVREKVAQLYGFDLTKPAEEERHVYRSRRHQYE